MYVLLAPATGRQIAAVWPQCRAARHPCPRCSLAGGAGSTLRLELAWWGPPSGQRAYPLLLLPKLSHGHRARAHTRPWTCQHTRPTSIRPSPVTFCAGPGETMVVQLLRSGWSSSPACRTMCCRGAHARRQCHFQDGPQPATIPTPAACHLPILARILEP